MLGAWRSKIKDHHREPWVLAGTTREGRLALSFPHESGELIPTAGAGADNTRAMGSTPTPDFHIVARSTHLRHVLPLRAPSGLVTPSAHLHCAACPSCWPRALRRRSCRPWLPSLRSTPAFQGASGAFLAFWPCPDCSVSPLTDARDIYLRSPPISLDIRKGGNA